MLHTSRDLACSTSARHVQLFGDDMSSAIGAGCQCKCGPPQGGVECAHTFACVGGICQSGAMRVCLSARSHLRLASTPSSRLKEFQAAAAIAGKDDIHGAAFRGNAALVADHIIADPKCVHKKNNVYNTFFFFCTRVFENARFDLVLPTFNSLVHVEDYLHSIGLLMLATSKYLDFLWSAGLT